MKNNITDTNRQSAHTSRCKVLLLLLLLRFLALEQYSFGAPGLN